MPIELTAKIVPKNDAFVGMVDAKQVLGGGDSGTLPDACVAESNITQHEAAIDHTAIDNIGTNSHADIDTHLADTVDPHGSTMEVTVKVQTPEVETSDAFVVDVQKATTSTMTVKNDGAGSACNLTVQGQVRGSYFMMGGSSKLVDTANKELLTTAAADAAAVNNLHLAHAQTGNTPGLSAVGDDTNIGIGLTPKGTGQVEVIGGLDVSMDATVDGKIVAAEIETPDTEAFYLDAYDSGSTGKVYITNTHHAGDRVRVYVYGKVQADYGMKGLSWTFSSSPGYIYGVFDEKVMAFEDVDSADNWIVCRSAVQGSAPILKTNGNTDANVDLDVQPKGSGQLTVNGSAVYCVGGTDVGIADGGTGQSSKTAGFDALSPTTTLGDLIVSDGSDNVRKAAGSDGQVLIADDSQSDGLVWEDDIVSGGGELPSPAVDDEFWIKDLPYNVTFTEVYYHVVEGTGTVSFDIIRRARAASGSSGTDITASPIQATTTGAATTSFANNGDGSQNEWLILKVTATTLSPTKLRWGIRYKRRK